MDASLKEELELGSLSGIGKMTFSVYLHGTHERQTAIIKANASAPQRNAKPMRRFPIFSLEITLVVCKQCSLTELMKNYAQLSDLSETNMTSRKLA